MHVVWEQGESELPYGTRNQGLAPAGMVKQRKGDDATQREPKHGRVRLPLKRVQETSV